MLRMPLNKRPLLVVCVDNGTQPVLEALHCLDHFPVSMRRVTKHDNADFGFLGDGNNNKVPTSIPVALDWMQTRYYYIYSVDEYKANFMSVQPTGLLPDPPGVDDVKIPVLLEKIASDVLVPISKYNLRLY